MLLTDFDYHLPPERIAQTPLELRDHSKLMVLNRHDQSIIHKRFFELPELLSENDVLVFNQSRVIPARLKIRLENEKEAEILILKPLAKGQWECLVKPGKWFKEGSQIRIKPLCKKDLPIDEREGEIKVHIESVQLTGERVIRFEHPDLDAYLKQYGEIPTPPYIQEELKDPNRYQTVYAKPEGSVAAPTAGLHFTPELMGKLREKGVQTEFVTLHVGLGTFQPVKTENLTEHTMHSEWFELSEETASRLNEAKKQGKRIVAVGTTTVRVLESCTDESGKLEARSGETNIFIYPGYQWKFVDALITNFHVPKSTLLMLVSSFAEAKKPLPDCPPNWGPPNPIPQNGKTSLSGREFILKAYQKAIEKDYRFFSFGDAMLMV